MQANARGRRTGGYGEFSAEGISSRHPGRVGRGGARLSQMAIDAQAEAGAREDIANLWRQVHGLRSKLHGELGVLALRIEDNERRAMKRRRVLRRWVMVAVVVVCLWLGSSAVRGMFGGPFLLPVLLLVGLALVGGVTLVVLGLHNDADEQEHRDRHHNWFRLTTRDDPGSSERLCPAALRSPRGPPRSDQHMPEPQRRGGRETA